MRVLICGGRDYGWRFDENGRKVPDEKQRRRFNRTMENMVRACLGEGRAGHIIVIHGAAAGADTLASEFALQTVIAGCTIEEMPFPADWNKHRKAAGPIRNQQMLKEGKPDLVIAFPGGRGTAHMIKIATAAGVPVWRVKDE